MQVESELGKFAANENNPLLLNQQQQILQSTSQAHLMQSTWNFWFHQRQPFAGEDRERDKPEATSYREQLKSIGQIPTIEHFFNYYVFMKKPSEMPRDIDLFFFRDKQMPMWEVSVLSDLNSQIRSRPTVGSGLSKFSETRMLIRCGKACFSH